jgi:hypothetical protein
VYSLYCWLTKLIDEHHKEWGIQNCEKRIWRIRVGLLWTVINCSGFKNNNSMRQGYSWKTDSRSVGQNISGLLCNPKGHNHAHKGWSLDHIPSQINPSSASEENRLSACIRFSKTERIHMRLPFCLCIWASVDHLNVLYETGYECYARPMSYFLISYNQQIIIWWTSEHMRLERHLHPDMIHGYGSNAT